jgi:DNA-binding CsgD family transcriptional regulator/ArsR family metal-binding transcriptional regulator
MGQVGSLEKHDFSKAYTTLRLFSSGPLSGQAADVDCGNRGARFELGFDLSPLFPYINALADQAHYYDKPVYIKFLLAGRLCAFYPCRGAFAPVRDMAEALDFLAELLAFLVDVSRRTADTVPNHKKYNPASALDIFRLLPGTNCRECGHATCMAFAAALSRQHIDMGKCPYLTRPVAETATFPVCDAQGNVVRTVTMDIDTAGFREAIDRQEATIRALESRLAEFENNHAANFEAANAGLPVPLSRREIQVLRRIVGGATNREMSADLNISQHTVKSHVNSVFNKLGVNDRAQAAAWGAMHGIDLYPDP